MKRIWLLCLALALPFAHAALPIQSWELPNGTRVLLVKNHVIPIIDVQVEFDAGSRRDPKRQSGLAALTNGMLARGVASANQEPALSEAQISDAFADTAAQRGGGVDVDSARVNLRTLSSQPESDRSISLLARILAQPRFPSALLARDKARTISAIKDAETKPAVIGQKKFWRMLYGDHPYGYAPSPKSIAAIKRSDLLAFHRAHYVASRAVVTIVGDVTRKQANHIAWQLTHRLSSGKNEKLPAMQKVPLARPFEERISHPASQAHVLIGMPVLKRGDPDFFPLIVGNYVLGGGGFVSRLMQEVREKRGLSYSVYSRFQPRLQRGPFYIGLQTQKQQTNEALKIAREVLTVFLQKGPTQTELQAAKDNLIGSFALRLDSNRKILRHVAMIGYYRLPLNYLDTWNENVSKVGVDDVRKAFQRKIDVAKMATVIVAAPE